MPNGNDINQHPLTRRMPSVGPTPPPTQMLASGSPVLSLLSKLIGGRDSSLENAASIAQLIGAGGQASNMAGQTLITNLLNDLINSLLKIAA